MLDSIYLCIWKIGPNGETEKYHDHIGTARRFGHVHEASAALKDLESALSLWGLGFACSLQICAEGDRESRTIQDSICFTQDILLQQYIVEIKIY